MKIYIFYWILLKPNLLVKLTILKNLLYSIKLRPSDTHIHTYWATIIVRRFCWDPVALWLIASVCICRQLSLLCIRMIIKTILTRALIISNTHLPNHILPINSTDLNWIEYTFNYSRNSKKKVQKWVHIKTMGQRYSVMYAS